MSWMKHLHKDHLAGALMVLVGLAAVYFGAPLQIGTLLQMGPGYFPVALGILLTFVGIVIAIGGGKPAEPSRLQEFPGQPADMREAAMAAARKTGFKPEWRGWGCILGGFAAFVFLFKYAGAVPATTVLVFVSALGERGNSLLSAILLTVFADVVLVVVFYWTLKMPLHLFWWN